MWGLRKLELQLQVAPGGCCLLNSGPPQEQYGLLTTGPSLLLVGIFFQRGQDVMQLFCSSGPSQTRRLREDDLELLTL